MSPLIRFFRVGGFSLKNFDTSTRFFPMKSDLISSLRGVCAGRQPSVGRPRLPDVLSNLVTKLGRSRVGYSDEQLLAALHLITGGERESVTWTPMIALSRAGLAPSPETYRRRFGSLANAQRILRQRS